MPRKQAFTTPFSSRQYMLSRDFEIFYYNDSHLQSVDNHTHDYYEFYFFLGGKVSMSIRDEEYPLQKGDMILIPPGVRHHLRNHNPDLPYQRFIFWITKEYLSRLTAQSPDYSYLMQETALTRHFIYHFDVLTFNALQGKIYALLEEIHSLQRFGHEARLTLDVADLVLSVNRYAYEQDHPASERETQHLYENILTYMDRHLTEELSLDRIADNFFVSKYYVAHVFKEQMGLSVHQYIQKKRLERSCEAILAGENIHRACELCGFGDYSSYFRAFKKEYGLSPSEYADVHGGMLRTRES